jgi:pimeloyl-ACP methyl ester carboxylesterase
MSDKHNSARTQFVDVGGVRYAYRRFGMQTGTPIVLLQHFRGGLDNWDPVVTDGLAKDRPVILFNNAGVASSGGEPADTVGGMAVHVIAFLEALRLKEVDLLGLSLGGFVAQQTVLARADLIRHVILAGTGPQGAEGMDRFTPKVTEHATPGEPNLKDSRRSDGEGLGRGENDGGSEGIPFITEASFGIADRRSSSRDGQFGPRAQFAKGSLNRSMERIGDGA